MAAEASEVRQGRPGLPGAGVVATFFRRVVADLVGIPFDSTEPERHLAEAEAWLVRAHDVSPDGGVSYGYSLRGGWRPSYRETSGYIVPTFFRLAQHRQRPEYRERGLSIARWLMGVQNADGSFNNPRFGPKGIVFDTGQGLFGLLAAFEQSGDERFLGAARRAGDWLVAVADSERRWTKHVYLGVPHVYNTRTAWALSELHALEPSRSYERIARANLDYALERERGGYFVDCGFRPGTPAPTHTIAYTIRGLQEAGRLLGDARYLGAAERAARAMLRHLRSDGFLPGEIDERGREAARFCCLTGNCQLGVIWAKFHQSNGDAAFRRAALRSLQYVMGRQDIETSDLDVRGAIKGSHPIWGRYAPFSYPNWATKFFIDALLATLPWSASESPS
ncbi:MAG TPA: hypothetical protein VNN80_35220 [Polyangiaceae bacterium]|jgi:hypothetical protein|nr:hypothetical protein [Polyangiaceae bacterium]